MDRQPGLIAKKVSRMADLVWSGWDRLTHSQSRRRARARLARAGRPRSMLIICSGNICRSPYARTFLLNALERAGLRDLRVDSAGFFGPDRPADPRGSVIARQRGIDLDGHRSRMIRSADGRDFDLFIVMTRRHREQLVRRFGVARERIALLGDFDVTDPPEREIVDPYGQPDAVFEKAFSQIERSVQGLSEMLREIGR